MRASCLIACVLLVSCGAPEVVDRGPDHMEFADDPDDSALERIPTPRQPVRLVRPVSARAIQALPVQAPPPRCEGNKAGPSRSVGQATEGTLENPCRIAPSGPGYLSASPNAFATDESVAWIQWAAAQVAQQFPGSPLLVIGSLSAERGGFLKPHKSHQSGRDADLGYFHSNSSGARRFQATDAGNLDAEKTWAFLEALLYTGDVEFVFMDYEIQAALYNALLDNGWTETTLAPMFQYPAGPTVPRGIIRHAKGHADHFHVRFRCPERDKPECVD